MKPNTNFKLYNAITKRKESWNYPRGFLFSPLLPEPFPPVQTLPDLAMFPNLLSLRAFFVADWLRRLLLHNGSSLETVGTPEQANLTLLEIDTYGRGERARFVLEVAGFVGSEEAVPHPLDQPYDVETLRYYAMSGHYRTALQWNDSALTASKAALERLRQYAQRFEAASSTQSNRASASNADLADWRERFYSSLNDDLNMARALAVIWTLLQNPLPETSKLALLREFDQLLGLRLTSFYQEDSQRKPQTTPQTKPKAATPIVKNNKPPEPTKAATNQSTKWRVISSTREVRSLLDEPDKFDFTVSIVSYQNSAPANQTLDSVLPFLVQSRRKIEVIVADLGGDAKFSHYLEGLAAKYNSVRIVHANAERFLGEAAGRNIALRQGRGKYILLLDSGLTFKTDIFDALFSTLEKFDKPGLYGLYPLEVLREGVDVTEVKPLSLPEHTEPQEVEAVEGALLCFRRNLVEEVGFLDERFRYPFVLDLDYCFNFHDKGLPVFALPNSIANQIQKPNWSYNRQAYGLPVAQIEQQQQKNWQLFLKSWSI